MTSPYPVLVLAVLFVSFGSVLIRLAEAPPLAVSFYRIALAALCLFPFAARGARSSWKTLTPRRRLVLLASGAALAVHFATWVASLSYTSVAASAFVPTLAGHGLVNRSLRALPAPTVGLFLLGEPLGASALAWLVLDEVPGAWTLAGGAVVLLALALVLLRRA